MDYKFILKLICFQLMIIFILLIANISIDYFLLKYYNLLMFKVIFLKGWVFIFIGVVNIIFNLYKMLKRKILFFKINFFIGLIYLIYLIIFFWDFL